jgi:hypothetical protein
LFYVFYLWKYIREEKSMSFPQFPRGTAGILDRVRELCKFARRYPYAQLLLQRTGQPEMGAAVGSLIAACDAFEALDNNPWESDAVSPGTSPEDEEVT